MTACGVSGSSSFQGWWTGYPDEEDRPPPRKDFGVCFDGWALISRCDHELRNHLRPDDYLPEFTQMFHFFSKMTLTTVKEQKHLTLKV